MTARTDPNGWIMTRSGVKFCPLAPRAEDVRVDDLAHALALTNRFCGHTRFPYSVAQHSVLASREMELLFGTLGGLVGLGHDGSEAYLCDIPRPVKRQVVGYEAAELGVQAVVYLALGVPLPIPLEIVVAMHHVDRRLLRTEQRDLMPPPAEGEDRTDAEPYDYIIREWPWRRARDAFAYRYGQLSAQLARAEGIA